MPSFRNMNQLALQHFSKCLTLKEVCKNQILYKQGDLVADLYIVFKGEFEVTSTLDHSLSNKTGKILELINRSDLNTKKNMIGETLPELKDYP